ncbi:hypothetical protein Ddye_011614 [Dipteronia dyeriana]|uniref:Uncharacterized protein n=1 Tax=Dipteronia dyeriana TaxID=168575 RepID=A0AAD9X2V8_9ROSI|nr:hypothetical protein Ddye_011614 [Dipteronia dyeriana]
MELRSNVNLVEGEVKFKSRASNQFADRLRDEPIKNDPEGNELDKITMFKVTYTRKKGKPTNPTVANAMRRMDELITNQPYASKNKVFNQVIGEVSSEAHVSTLTYGLGINRFKKRKKYIQQRKNAQHIAMFSIINMNVINKKRRKEEKKKIKKEEEEEDRKRRRIGEEEASEKEKKRIKEGEKDDRRRKRFGEEEEENWRIRFEEEEEEEEEEDRKIRRKKLNSINI